MSAQWPSALSSASNLYTAVNLLTTTLSVSMTTSTPSVMTLASTTGFPTAGAVTVDNEVIFYTGVSGSTLTGLTRGADGTTAASHNSGVPVGATVIANHINALTAEVIALETDLHTRIGYANGNNQVILASGAVGAPALSLGGLASGLYSSATNVLDFVSNGVTAFEVGTNCTVTNTLNVSKTTNQIALGTTKVLTISSTAPATSQTYTIPDVASAANFLLDQGAYTIAGNWTHSGTVTISGAASLTFSGSAGNPIRGTTSNTAPAASYVGEVISSAVTNIAITTTNTWQDLTSITLTSGHWLIYGQTTFSAAGTTTVECQMGVSSTSGNSTTGLTLGDNKTEAAPPTSNYNTSACIVGYEVKLSGTTTYYLKNDITFTGTSPQNSGRITAVRIS